MIDINKPVGHYSLNGTISGMTSELPINTPLFAHAMPKSELFGNSEQLPDTQPSTDVSELVQALSAAKPAIINFSDYWYDKDDRALADKYNEMLSTINALIAKHTVK